MSVGLVDVLLAGSGTIENPYDAVTVPARMAEAVVFDPETGHLEWTEATEISTGTVHRRHQKNRTVQPYGVIRWVEELEWLKEKGLYRPDAGRAMAHIAFLACYLGHRIPSDCTVDHVEELCPGRNTKCCNPHHLEVVSAEENTRRMHSSVRRPLAIYPTLFASRHFSIEAPRPGITELIDPAKTEVFRSSKFVGVPGNSCARVKAVI